MRWNERNQLASAAAGTGSSGFGYDALGRRVSPTSGGVTTQYLYDGLNVVRELSTAGNAELLSERWSNQGVVPGAIADMETADPCKPRDFGGPCSPKVPSPTPVVLPAPSQALEGLALFMIGFELLVEGPPTSIALGALLGTPFGPIGIVTAAILGMGAAVEEALIASELMALGAQMMGLSGPMAPGPLQPKQ